MSPACSFGCCGYSPISAIVVISPLNFCCDSHSSRVLIVDSLSFSLSRSVLLDIRALIETLLLQRPHLASFRMANHAIPQQAYWPILKQSRTLDTLATPLRTLDVSYTSLEYAVCSPYCLLLVTVPGVGWRDWVVGVSLALGSQNGSLSLLMSLALTPTF